MEIALKNITAQEMSSLIQPVSAVEALRQVLLNGFDPELDSPRKSTLLSDSEVLMMPSELSSRIGVKVLAVAHGNPAGGWPMIQGIYILFDRATKAPIATMDGAALTLLRTPAVTALALSQILRIRLRLPATERPPIRELVVYGTGPQAARHAGLLASICNVGKVSIIGRDSARTRTLILALEEQGIPAFEGSARKSLPGADVIVTATSSSTALFDKSLVSPGATIAAIGAHGLGKHELDPALVRASQLVVESRRAASLEDGELAAASEQMPAWEPRTTSLSELVNFEVSFSADSPVIYSGVGMSWEDLTVASEIYLRSIGKSSVPRSAAPQG